MNCVRNTAPAFTWDDSLAKQAQKTASKCAFKHSGEGGENLFETTAKGGNIEKDAVDDWYNEIK